MVCGEGATVVVAKEINSGDGMTALRHGCDVDYRHRGERASINDGDNRREKI